MVDVIKLTNLITKGKNMKKQKTLHESLDQWEHTGFSESEGKNTDFDDDPHPSAGDEYDEWEHTGFSGSNENETNQRCAETIQDAFVEKDLEDTFFGVSPKSNDERWAEIRHDYRWRLDITEEDEIKRRRTMIEANYQELNPEVASQREAELKRREVLKTAAENSPEYRKAIGEDRQARIAAMRAHYRKEEKTDDVASAEGVNLQAESVQEEKGLKDNSSLIKRLFVRKVQNG